MSAFNPQSSRPPPVEDVDRSFSDDAGNFSHNLEDLDIASSLPQSLSDDSDLLVNSSRRGSSSTTQSSNRAWYAHLVWFASFFHSGTEYSSMQDAATAAQQAQVLETDRLRNTVRGLSYDEQSNIALFFISWLKPFSQLSLVSNITSDDLPSQPATMRSTPTFIQFAQTWQQYISSQKSAPSCLSRLFCKKSSSSRDTCLTNDDVMSSEQFLPQRDQIDTRIDITSFRSHPFVQRLSYRMKGIAASSMPVSIQKFPKTLWITLLSFPWPAIITTVAELCFYVGSLLQPACVKSLSRYFDRFNAHDSSASLAQGLWYALLLGVSSFAVTNAMFIRHQAGIQWACRTTNSLLTALFDKTLRVAPSALSGAVPHAAAPNTKAITSPSAPTISSVSSPLPVSTPAAPTVASSAAAQVPNAPQHIETATETLKKKMKAQDPNSSLKVNSTGAITNLVSQDTMQSYAFAIYANQVWSAPFSATLCVLLMYMDLGSTSFIVMLLMLLLVPYQTIIVAIQRHYRKKNLQVTDERIKYTSQLLSGIRVIKLYAWEEPLSKRLAELRDLELFYQRLSLFWKFFANIFTYLYPLAVTFISLVFYSHYHSDFSPEKVFMLLSYLNAIRIPIQFLSTALQCVVETSVSMDRIGNFLCHDEIPLHQGRFEALAKLQSTDSASLCSPSASIPHEEQPNDDDVVVRTTNCDFYWSSFDHNPNQTPVLSDISLSVKRGEIVGILSHSGRGSTALLTAILGELYPTHHKSFTALPSTANFDQATCVNNDFSFINNTFIIPDNLLHISGNVAYCAQQPFLLADTLRNNIILELEFDAVKFARVVEAAALGPDLEILPAGMHSLVSEAGVSLSGGQQARVAFARALYHADVVDIVILDDIFAAVDALVARTMFFKGVRGILRDKAVLLAINSHYDFLQFASRVIVLDYTSDPYWLQLHYYLAHASQNVSSHLDQKQYQSSFSDTFSAAEDYSLLKSNDEIQSNSAQVSLPDDDQEDECNTLRQSSLPSILPNFINETGQMTLLPVKYTPELASQLHGYRQPATITFSGSFDELLRSKIDLLGNFTASMFTPEESSTALFTDTPEGLDEALKLADFGAKGPATGALSSAQGVVEGSNNNTSSSSSPSQADLPSSLYLDYIAGSHAFWGMVIIVSLMAASSFVSQLSLTVTDLWIVRWSSDSASDHPHPLNYWVRTTAGIIAITGSLFFIQSLVFLYVALDASRWFHAQALHRVFSATMSYLDTTPLGQLVNRFTKDLETIDRALPDNFIYLVQQGFIFIGIMMLSCITSWTLLLPLVPLFFLARNFRRSFHGGSVQLKRLESASLTPMFTLFSNVLKGNATIRAYGLQTHFIERYRRLVDKYSQVKLILLLIERRFSYQLNSVSALYIWILASGIVVLRNHIDSDLGLLALTYSLRLVGLVQMVVRLHTQTSQAMTSIHRLKLLESIPQEPDFYSSPQVKASIENSQPERLRQEIAAYNQYTYGETHPNLDKILTNPSISFGERHQKELYYWPWNGAITFDNVCLRYRPDLPIILNKLSVCIAPGQSVGLVGRSGAGKSTILQALFRMIEPASGQIRIDGVDIQKLGVGDLRSRLSIVPQSPTLFSGTIRSNLDPLDRFSDAELWTALEFTAMTTKIQQLENGLLSVVQENGSNFSASERQLLCIARALLFQSAKLHALAKNNSNSSLPDHETLHTHTMYPGTTSTTSQSQTTTSITSTGPPTVHTGSILVADEMTSSLPNDDLIQHTIRNAFAQCTMLIIAHRLNTVADLDRILVIRPLTEDNIIAGWSSLVEYGTPYDLLNDPTSEFYTMCQNTGQENFAILYEKAKNAYPITLQKELAKGFPKPVVIRGENTHNQYSHAQVESSFQIGEDDE